MPRTSRRVSRQTLFFVAGTILFGAFLLATGLAQRPPAATPEAVAQVYDRQGYAAGERHVMAHLRTHPQDAEAWRVLVERRGQFERQRTQFAEVLGGAPGGLGQAPAGAEDVPDEATFLAFVDQARVIPPYVLRAWYRLCASDDLDDGLDALFRELPPDPNDLVEAAEMAHHVGRYETALAYYQQAETVFRDDPAVVGGLLDTLSHLRRFDALSERLRSPHQRAHASEQVLIDDALHRRDLVELVVRLTREDLAKFSPAIGVAVAGSALCWFLFLFFLGEVPSWPRRRRGYALLALGLGVAAAIVTLAVAVLQDDVIGHAERAPTEGYLLTYFVLGVGFREELIKLLFFLPLAPLLIKAVPMERLIIASLVGLGFAAQENAVYFASEGGPVMIARFLTANFFHLSLTGLTGYALVRALDKGGEEWMNFTTTFFTMVVLHGLYDYLLTSRLLGGGLSFFSMTVFIFVSLRYLHDARGMMHIYGTRLAMPLVFTVSLCTAVGINYVLISLQAGPVGALSVMFAGLIGNAVIAYMFFREYADEVL